MSSTKKRSLEEIEQIHQQFQESRGLILKHLGTKALNEFNRWLGETLAATAADDIPRLRFLDFPDGNGRKGAIVVQHSEGVEDTPDNLLEIALGLSMGESQLMHAFNVEKGIFHNHLTDTTLRSMWLLEDRGLVERVNNKMPVQIWKLTSLGLAVKKVIDDDYSSISNG